MNQLRLVALIILTGLTFISSASETIIGPGIPYTARLVFEKSDINKIANSNDKNVTIKSGEELLPSKQTNSTLTAVPIPTVKSNGWCDPEANPNISTTDITQCYGRSNQSSWFLMDLSKLGTRKVWVQISAQKDEASTDEYLVPALTVWRGQQNRGLTGDWYPNRFQGYAANGAPDNSVSKTFWAWNLTPLNNTAGKLSWASASANTDKTKITLTQQVALKGGESNYLTVILGSDNQEAPNQDANYKLLVRLSSQKPTTNPGDSYTTPPPPTSKFDQYGCTIGLTCWHQSMGHCMSVSSCNGLTGSNKCLCAN